MAGHSTLDSTVVKVDTKCCGGGKWSNVVSNQLKVLMVVTFIFQNCRKNCHQGSILLILKFGAKALLVRPTLRVIIGSLISTCWDSNPRYSEKMTCSIVTVDN